MSSTPPPPPNKEMEAAIKLLQVQASNFAAATQSNKEANTEKELQVPPHSYVLFRCVGYGVCPIDVLQEYKEMLDKTFKEEQSLAASLAASNFSAAIVRNRSTSRRAVSSVGAAKLA